MHDPAELMPQVYEELRRLAAGYLRHERPGQTLQATALVHEAFVRLSQEKSQPWKNRTHFLAIAALSMRQILVQRARARHAHKRGGEHAQRITLDESVMADHTPDTPGGVDVLALDAALDKLASLDPQQAKIVELRYFGGLTVEEVADALEISPATVKRHWTLARAFLKRELQPELVAPKRSEGGPVAPKRSEGGPVAPKRSEGGPVAPKRSEGG